LGYFLHFCYLFVNLSALQKKNFYKSLKINILTTNQLLMKNIIYAFVAILFVACGTQAPCECEKETNGFGPFEGQTVYIGSQETVDVFNAIDAAWAARDYEAMKSLINDGGNFTFENGTVVTTAQEFVDFVEQEYQKTIADGREWGWNTDYAFAAYVAGSDDPEAWNQAGEWVNAQFTGSDGVYIEWYHIADGKLQNWNQTKAALPQE